ncbi:probable 2-oxoglutarate-dependent dioxygenase At3g111800 [Punica granatum]|uniref:Probable 2-oxoglutarate-dependent dioxygenase At3g111800 n=1 Tax=Punica granatum TaxID=22663 RepID=A0A218WZP7_PUNGR|nr:probable 2-oxoglutarate-dependent dioxygenase At3g111800 [Punica granatum]OWM77711.1 hypothetical protein CDL15_Pgr012413 [Punica granatum]
MDNNSPESISSRDRPFDFRAPPPSPVASGRRSCVTNDDVLTEFLETSLRVPDLVLPDKIFPKQKFIENPSKIDYEALVYGSKDYEDATSKMLDSIARVGCFQLVNFGISSDLLKSVLDAARGIFRVPLDKRVAVTRSPENRSGFEEVHSEDDTESGQEFVWSRDEDLKLAMEKLWPTGYSNFSETMGRLQSDVEEVAGKIFSVVRDIFLGKLMGGKYDFVGVTDLIDFVCCLHKHRPNVPPDQYADLLRYDVIKMMIRVNDYSHALCLHIFDGSSEFHVYSKKGWVSFCPEKDSIIVTVGDQFQALSQGQYKHVVGRPVYRSEGEDRISMAFLYSPPPLQPPPRAGSSKDNRGRDVISISQQVVTAVVLTIVYQLLVYICKNF